MLPLHYSLGYFMPKIYFEEMFPELNVPNPKPAVYSTAKWWKDMDRYDPSTPDEVGKIRGHAGDTVRGCPAVDDIVNSGYILFTPADIHVDASNDELVYSSPDFVKGSRAADKYIYLSHHKSLVLNNYEAAKDYNPSPLRVHTYWGVKTDEGYSTMFVHPMHRMDLPFHIVTAIVDTDSLTANTSFSVLIKKGFVGLIPRGTPLVQVIPYKREAWEHEITEFDELKFRKDKHLMASVFERPYKKLFWNRKKYT